MDREASWAVKWQQSYVLVKKNKKKNIINIVKNTVTALWNQSSWTNISVHVMLFFIPHSG